VAIRADPEPGQAAGGGRRLLETVVMNEQRVREILQN